MRRTMTLGLGLLLFLVTPVSAQQAEGKLVRDVWEAAFIDGAKVGYNHLTVREVEKNGKKVLRATADLDLTIQRFKATARIRMQTGTEETPDGVVTGILMKQFQGDKVTLVLTGAVDGDSLVVSTEDGRIKNKRVPWTKEVVGLSRQDRTYQDRKVKPGDSLSFKAYQPIINSVVTVRSVVKDEEEVDVLGQKLKLLRVEETPDKVMGPMGPIPLPKLTGWLNADREFVCSQMEMEGVGTILMVRTTKDIALARGTAKVADIGVKSLIKLPAALKNATETSKVVYRITVKDDDEPASVFATDDRQAVKEAKGNTFELVVKAIRSAGEGERKDVGDEFRKANYYLNSDDAAVKKFADTAVGKETDPWKKAQRIEQWVYRNVRPDNSVPFATASQVAADPRGDCRHKAMLSAAMCRAAGVPSRTAVGLVYAQDRQTGPFLAFHMWTEVAIRGQWVAIDGTQGLGSVGADHIKISDSSWSEAQSLTPLLPVARVLGKVTIEVVQQE